MHTKTERDLLDEWLTCFTNESGAYAFVESIMKRSSIRASDLYTCIIYAEHGKGGEHLASLTHSVKTKVKNPISSMAAGLLNYYGDEFLENAVNINLGQCRTEPLVSLVKNYNEMRSKPWMFYDIHEVKQYILDEFKQGYTRDLIVENLVNNHNKFKYSQEVASSTVDAVLEEYLREVPEPCVPSETKPMQDPKVIEVGDWFYPTTEALATMEMTRGKAYQCIKINIDDRGRWVRFVDDKGDEDFHTPNRFVKCDSPFNPVVPEPTNLCNEITLSDIAKEEDISLNTEQPIVEETKMSKTNLTIVVSTAAYTEFSGATVFGKDVTTLDESDLFRALRQVDADIKNLKDLGTGTSSARITKQLAALRKGKKAIVAAIDALPEDDA